MSRFLHRLSLIEDENAEREEAEIEDYESDSDRESAYTLVKTENSWSYKYNLIISELTLNYYLS